MKKESLLKQPAGGSKARPQKSGCLILSGVFLAAIIIAVLAAMFGILNLYNSSQAVAMVPPAETDNAAREKQMARQENEEARLNSYGWIEKESDLVRIPITRALALIAESGLPVGNDKTEAAIANDDLPTITPIATIESLEEQTPTPEAESPSGQTPMPESESPNGQTPTPESESAAGQPPALEPSATVPLTPTVDLSNVSFAANVLPIFEQHCIQCHGGERPEGGLRTEEGLSLTSVADIMEGSWNGSVVEPGNIEDSYLIEQIVSGRMPKEGPGLTQDQIEIITAWVEAGAPDN